MYVKLQKGILLFSAFLLLTYILSLYHKDKWKGFWMMMLINKLLIFEWSCYHTFKASCRKMAVLVIATNESYSVNNRNSFDTLRNVLKCRKAIYLFELGMEFCYFLDMKKACLEYWYNIYIFYYFRRIFYRCNFRKIFYFRDFKELYVPDTHKKM